MKYVEPIRSREEIDAVLSAFTGPLAPRNRALFLLGITSALRISDLLALRWTDVLDLEDYNSGHGSTLAFRPSVEVRERKTGKRKVFPLGSIVAGALGEWRSVNRGEWLFSNAEGCAPISRVQAWRVLSRAAALAGLKGIGTHSLRKTWGYHARKNGVSIALIMEALNHSSEGVTLRYLGFTGEEVRAAYDLVGGLLTDGL